MARNAHTVDASEATKPGDPRKSRSLEKLRGFVRRAEEHARRPGVARESATGSPTVVGDASQAGVEQTMPPFPRWLGRLGYYGLALFLVGGAALLHWALSDALSPTPFLVFYLAWVAAAVFGGLGPGLLATLVSWWCIEFLFDRTPSHIGLHDAASIARLLVFLAGGLVISVVGEGLRRARIHERRQGRELADLNAVLRASEEKYRIVADNTYDWEFWLDPEDRFLYTSPSCERITGYGAQEFMKRPGLLEEIIHPEDLPALLEHQRETPPRHPGDIEFRIITKMGEIRWIHHLCQPVYDKDGRYAGCRGSNRDVTERKQAEEALRESEEKFRLLAETSPAAILIYQGGKYVYANPAVESITGYTCGEVLQQAPGDIVHPDYRQQVKQQASRRTQGEGLPMHYEAKILTKDGQERWMDNATVSIMYGNRPAGLVVAFDITERKRGEEALAESRKRYRRLVEKVNDWVWEIDANGVYTYSSPRALELLGYAPEEIVGKTPFDLMPPAEAQRVWNAFQPIWLERRPLELLENTLVRKDGGLVTVETSGMPVFAEDGAFLGYTGIDRDVTARKQAEQDLSESRNRYQALIETTADFIWEMDASGKYTYCSPQMKSLWGYEPKDMIGKTPFDVMPPEDRKHAIGTFMSLAKSPKPFTGLEASSYDSRGRLIAVEISGVPFFDADGRLLGYRGISRDVTQRKRAEEALRASQSMLQSVMENIPQGIFWKDRHSTYLGGNKVFVKAVGLESARDIIGKTDYDLPWSPEQTASFREYDRRIMENDAPEYHIIEQIREADGRLAWVETNKVPLHDAQGHVGGILGTYEDITERKQAEEALRQAKAFTDKLLNAPLDTVFVFEPVTGKPVRWNKRFAEVSGYDDEEIAGMKAPDDFCDEDDIEKAKESMGRILADGQGIVALSLITKQGVHIPFEYVATVVQAEDGKTLFLSIGRDITERKRAEEALRELNATLESRVAQRTAELEDRAKQLQKLTLDLTEAESRERKRLAAILHDDLQQTLAAAKFHLALVSNRHKDDETLQTMTGQVEELLVEAIGKSRNLSRELSPPGLAHSDLQETFEWLAGQMQAKHGLTVHVAVRDQIELRSEPLKALLFKAAQEMLFNVVKHAQVREAWLRLRCRRGNICLTVSDKGRGFDPQRPDSTAGSGLLSIRERVNLLGGRMKVRSAKGKGSTFLIVVPDTAQQTNQTDHA
jgi:PAS domain S-box-containing protein